MEWETIQIPVWCCVVPGHIVAFNRLQDDVRCDKTRREVRRADVTMFTQVLEVTGCYREPASSFILQSLIVLPVSAILSYLS